MLFSLPKVLLKKLYPIFEKPWFGIIASITYVCLAVFSVIHFHVWSQVLWFWERDWPFNLTDVFVHKNALRYFLLLPTLELSRILQVDYNWLFSILVSIYILSTAYFVTRIVMDQGHLPGQFWFIFNINACFFILLSMFMNGRLASAFAGISLIQLCLQTRLIGNIKNLVFFPLVLTGLLLCSVSSGVFLVANLTVYFGIALYLLESFRWRGVTMSWVSLAIWYLIFLNFLSIMIVMDVNKELSYFHYDLFEMLEHGSGQFFYIFGKVGGIALLILGTIIAYFLIKLWYRFTEFHLFILPIALSLALGLFGYSTLLTGLPSVIVLLNIFCLRIIVEEKCIPST